jgi:hypothetical protein
MRTEHAAVSDAPPLAPGFLDRLGDRVQLTDRDAGHVEVLRLRPELTASSLFEPAVRRRAGQLAGFLHPNCARVHRVGRLPAPDGRLVILSDAVDGWRLSEVLEAAGRCGAAFHANAVLFLLRQLLGAVADLHEVAFGVSHGALGTERLVITADGRLVVTESVLGAALRHLPPMSSDRLWRDLRLAVADREAQPFGRLTDLRQVGIVALSLVLGRQLRRDEYPTRLASLLEEGTSARPGLGAEAPGPALRGWLLRVLSLTDDLTPWSVAEARRELDRLVETDDRYAFAPTGLPAILGRVADYYAAAAEVPVRIDQPPAPSDRRPGLVQVRPDEPAPRQDRPAETIAEQAVQPPALNLLEPAPPAGPPPECDALPSAVDVRQPAPDISQPAPEVLQPVPDDAWPEPVVRSAVDQLVDSHQEPLIETRSASMFAEPPSPSSVASIGPADGVGPLADPIAAEWADGVADQGGGRRRDADSPVVASAPRPFLGVHLAEDTLDPIAARSVGRTRTLIAVAAAAIVIVALGGYALVRPSSVGATATRRASSPPPTAVLDTASPTPASSAAPAAQAGAQGAPSTPQTPEALPPAAASVNPAPTGAIEVVSPVSLNVSEGGRALGASGAPIQLSVGRHTLDIGREDLGYQAVQVVDVKPGRPLRIEPSLPSGVANLNATPWAEVWIDGRKVGETPLGRVQLTIGSHEILFRHPELGDQTRTLVVTTGSVALLSVDWKK